MAPHFGQKTVAHFEWLGNVLKVVLGVREAEKRLFRCVSKFLKHKIYIWMSFACLKKIRKITFFFKLQGQKEKNG